MPYNDGPLGYLPVDLQQHLLGQSAPTNGRLSPSTIMAAMLGSPMAVTPQLPPVTSPEYAALVRAGQAPIPEIGTMEYLDFVQRNPGIIESLRARQQQSAGTGYNFQPASNESRPNPLDILAPLREPGYGAK